MGLSEYFALDYADRRCYYYDLLIVAAICADHLHEKNISEFTSEEQSKFLLCLSEVLKYCGKGICTLARTNYTEEEQKERIEEHDLRALN